MRETGRKARKKPPPRGRSSPRPLPEALHYKVVELSTVDEGSLERAVNTWTAQGWRLESVQFAMRESSKRPAMAFVFFTRPGAPAEEAPGWNRHPPGARRPPMPGPASRRSLPRETSHEPLRAHFRRPSLRLVPEEGIPESPYPRCSTILRVLARVADLGLASGCPSLPAGRDGGGAPLPPSSPTASSVGRASASASSG
jgi:hypothetical protein